MRYLSFLGIGKNVKQCAFIMHTAQDTFMAHVFHCEPSSGALCKTVEAACKVCARRTILLSGCLLTGLLVSVAVSEVLGRPSPGVGKESVQFADTW